MAGERKQTGIVRLEMPYISYADDACHADPRAFLASRPRQEKRGGWDVRRAHSSPSPNMRRRPAFTPGRILRRRSCGIGKRKSTISVTNLMPKET